MYNLFYYEMTFGQANMLVYIKEQSKEHQHFRDTNPAQKTNIRSLKVSYVPLEGFKRSLFFPTWILSIPRSEMRKRNVGIYFKVYLAFKSSLWFKL